MEWFLDKKERFGVSFMRKLKEEKIFWEIRQKLLFGVFVIDFVEMNF